MFEVEWDCDGTMINCTQIRRAVEEDCMGWYEYFKLDTCDEWWLDIWDCAEEKYLGYCNYTTGYDDCINEDIC